MKEITYANINLLQRNVGGASVCFGQRGKDREERRVEGKVHGMY
jgi:hypothetical protein